MWVPPKNDGVIMDAIKAQNSGHLQKAAAKFRDAANQYRNPAEKEELRRAADRLDRIRLSD
ncbi:hypothetical protein ACIPEN_22245 [Herbaspirillum chlorophenolicum]|uniref:Uncharacterized protein n=1 Tax=Herbaspirillum chlorophenolicum TaxID=211589 RepID=A0ABW8F5I7_9BURK